MTPKLSEAKGNPHGNYSKIFNSREIGFLISKVQSAVITSGTEIEKSIEDACEKKGILITDIDEFRENPKKGISIATKRTVKGTEFSIDKNEPDYIVFEIGKKRICHIVELKWGTDFDTKKAKGEIVQLKNCGKGIAENIEYMTEIHMVCFTAADREQIHKGFKKFVDKKDAMTGREFCKMLGISFDSIENPIRKSYMPNRKFFIKELFKIKELWPEMMDEIVANREFYKKFKAGHKSKKK